MKKNVFFISLVLLIGLSTWTAKAVDETVQVGTGQTYATLTSVFDAINSGALTGAIKLEITSDITESTTYPVLNASGDVNVSPAGTASYTSVHIYPTGVGPWTISGAATASLITLNGADNVNIDGRLGGTVGGTAKSLIIANSTTATGASTIGLASSAEGNTIQYCKLRGSSVGAPNVVGVSNGVIIFGASASGNGNDNNTITYNTITGSTDNSATWVGRPNYGIYAGDASAISNDNCTVSYNDFPQFVASSLSFSGAGVYLTNSNNTGWTISNNNFYEENGGAITSVGVTNRYAIIADGGSGFTVNNNNIGGNAPSCAGTLTKTGSNAPLFPIYLTLTAGGATTNIQGNTIKNFSWTNGQTAGGRGIVVTGAGDANIGTTAANTIGASTGTGSIYIAGTTSGINFYAIEVSTTGVTDIQNNIIGSITAGNAGLFGANFIGISKTGAGNCTISNNVIGSLSTAGSITCSRVNASQNATGIICAGTGTNTISNNTIANILNYTTTGINFGINCTGGTTTINANLIHSLQLTAANSGVGQVQGIVTSSVLPVTITNNIVKLGDDAIENVYGILTNVACTAVNVYHNTVYLTGTAPVGATQRSSCFFNNMASLASKTLYVRNNIFNTARTYTSGSTGTNVNAAIGGVVISNATSANFTWDNNDLYSATPATIGVSAAAGKTLSQWQTITWTGMTTGFGFDPNSVNVDPAFANASGTTAVDFKPTYMLGASTTGVTKDYSLTDRASGGYAIGAWDVSSGVIVAPSAPTALTFTPAANVTSLSVSFTAGSNGNGAITDYKYSINGGAYVSAGVTTSPITITGLTTATSYTVAIKAVNSTGDGTASATSTGRTSQTVVYVNSTTGSDTNDGLTAGTPILTVAKAIANSCPATTNIYLAAGNYVQTAPIELSPLSNVNLTISGESASNTIISTATSNCRLIKADLAPWLTSANTLTIRNLTLSGVNALTASYGGALYLQQGTGAGMSNSIILENLIVKNNTITNAGGFGGVGLGTNCKDVTITNCYFKNNRGLTGNVTGGAIYIGAPAAAPNGKYITISNTTFDGNESTRGGAIYLASLANQAKTGNYVKLTNCTFVNNKIDSDPTNVTTTNRNGAAVYLALGSVTPNTYIYDVTIVNCTFAKNQGGPAIGSVSPVVWETKSAVHFDGTTGWGTTTLVNNIFAPSLTANCGTTLSVTTAESTMFTAGYNAIESVDPLTTDATFAADAAANHNTIGALNPSNLDAALTDNTTGSVFAVPYLGLPGVSIAINAGTNSFGSPNIVPSNDVRGAGIAGSNKDMGAFEFNGIVTTSNITIDNYSTVSSVYQQGTVIVVDMSALEGMQTVLIYDIQGKNRLSIQANGGTKTAIENSLKSGIYIVKIQGVEKTFVTKLLLK